MSPILSLFLRHPVSLLPYSRSQATIYSGISLRYTYGPPNCKACTVSEISEWVTPRMLSIQQDMAARSEIWEFSNPMARRLHPQDETCGDPPRRPFNKAPITSYINQHI